MFACSYCYFVDNYLSVFIDDLAKEQAAIEYVGIRGLSRLLLMLLLAMQ
jgi:hypothetical protein